LVEAREVAGELARVSLYNKDLQLLLVYHLHYGMDLDQYLRTRFEDRRHPTVTASHVLNVKEGRKEGRKGGLG